MRVELCPGKQRYSAAAWRSMPTNMRLAVGFVLSSILLSHSCSSADTGNVFLRFCKYLGKCSYEAGAATAMLLMSRWVDSRPCICS